MPPKKKQPVPAKKLISEISRLPDDASRKKFFGRHRDLVRAEFAQQLIEAVVPEGRIETQRALGIAETAIFLSHKLGDKDILGLSLRSMANALNLAGQNEFALEFHQQALKLFEGRKNQEEIARTLSASLQPFILLGEYDRAFAAAERARQIFLRLGEQRRLARLDNNVGNIFHRQDRFEEAFARYERSYEQLLPYGDSEELAIALNNMAVCLISLNDFPRALATYERARAYCGQHNMPLLGAQADYNIAYLYYLRGEYSQAIEMLHTARQQCEATGDSYHFALCHLDLSEIYLELNLSAEAKEMAHEGYLRFQKLGMGYEEAKCVTNEAIAFGQLGKALHSLELFAAARSKFVKEKNLVWPWLMDLYQAMVLCSEGRFFEARRLATRAAEFFDTSSLSGKAVLCHLLLARIAFETQDLALARHQCTQALDRLASLESPVLRYQAEFLMGQIQQGSGDPTGAYASYQSARAALEALRSRLRGEELKISFMKNRLEVYERLVGLCMNSKEGPESLKESFGYIELAKSRSLVELLMRQGTALPVAEAGQSGLVRRIREMREELNWYYRRIELEQLQPEEPSPGRIEKLQKQALAHENELLRVLRELPSPQVAGSVGYATALSSLEEVRRSVPEEAALVEFFTVKEEFIAAVITHQELQIIPLTPISRVVNLLRMFHFQISKFRLGSEYVRAFEDSLLNSVQAHLRDLHEELLGPLRDRLHVKHLVIVPHGVLHYVPFHALFDGNRYVMDSFTISYAPSASIFDLCQGKPSPKSSSSLILGVPDPRAPFIREEVRSVANIFPEAELVLGAEASEEALRSKGPDSRLIHIATHGSFRQDNPMFSGIRLGSAYLNLYDLYQLKLGAELVTLSGCATGLNVVAAGDELLGLVRGLLYAGAQSLLLTLWDVHDRSTADFMMYFYRRYRSGQDRVSALQGAMQELRERYPHPYFWAPFVLVGKIFVQ